MRGQQKWSSNRPTPLPIIPERQKPPILSWPCYSHSRVQTVVPVLPSPTPDLPPSAYPQQTLAHVLYLLTLASGPGKPPNSILSADLILSELGTGPQFRLTFHRFAPKPCLAHLHFSTDSHLTTTRATAGPSRLPTIASLDQGLHRLRSTRPAVGCLLQLSTDCAWLYNSLPLA